MTFKRSKKIIAMVLAIATSLVLLVLTPMSQPGKSQFITIKSTCHAETVKGRPMQVRATAYAGDTITSTGTKPIAGHTIAVDPSVIPYGTRVYIPEFNKTFVAEDCGGAIKGNKIDIFMNSNQECIQWGVKTITIYILDK